ncbi:hypothetical protein TRFO_04051 [Tritrichomonas foetus]|uniref:DUF2428 domain-containing protein n=1 Tax=Tritrichomonas foetus TaxID=1144522 RepID=A0A1J4KN27_9EUKA|nr:hypothetical protein TRFO_04051 [Tritrichomonas foetus]|eukprot:OHT11102.1 hypothetical protein TRFO_04051 [Tritrichomonas foetus]
MIALTFLVGQIKIQIPEYFISHFIQMKALNQLIKSEPILSGKSKKKAAALIRNIIDEDVKSAICEFSTLLFNSDSPYFSQCLIKQIVKQLEAQGFLMAFHSLADSLIPSSFWKSDIPNICAFINYSHISPESIFNDHETDFLFIITKYLYSFPSIIFDDLLNLIDLYLQHFKDHPFEIPQELIQYVDDAFNHRKVQTIFATYFIKMADQKDVSISQLSKSFEIAINCLKNCFTKDELIQLRQNTSILFAVSMKPEQFLLLQSYFALSIQNEKLTQTLLQKINQFLKESSDQRAFECTYTSFLHVLGINELDQFIHFILRDYDTSYDEVRLALMKCFDKFLEIDSNLVVEKFTPHIVMLPWYSRLKRFTFPYLVKVGNKELFNELINGAQDPQLKSLVTKCMSEITNLDLFENVISQITSKLDLTKPLISFSTIFAACPKLATLCVQRNNSYLIKFDAAIANPKIFASAVTENDLINARKSFNFDLRIKCVAAFNAAGFPKNDEDAALFVESIPSLMAIDSLEHQSKLLKLFEDLIQNLTAKKYLKLINREQFINLLNEKISLFLLPSNNSNLRQNAILMLESIWKRFNEISPQVRLNLSSILKDGSVSLKKSAVSASKYLKEPLLLTNSQSDTSSEEKIEISELPKVNDLKSLQQFGILLDQINQNDSIVLKLNESHLNDLLKIDIDSINEWEIVGEIFHIICQLCIKLNVSQETIEHSSDHIFNSLINTRKSGLVSKCYPYLAQLINKLKTKFKSNNKPIEYSSKLVSVMAGFDMAQMRRSAGLPFISVALIKGNNEIFDELTGALMKVCTTSENANEAANALNTLNLIVKENNCPEKFFGDLFQTIFSCCQRFPNEWDVVSAVDLSYNSLLKKIWTFYLKESVFRNFSRTAFLSKVQNSRKVLTDALNSDVPHCIYLALVLFTLFPRDAGDSQFPSLILKHKSSKSSRIRRTAARALLNVISIDKNIDDFQIEAKDMNEKHFLAIFKQISNSKTFHPDPCLKKAYPLLFPPEFDFNININTNCTNDSNNDLSNEKVISHKLARLCLTLKNWEEKSAPEEVQRRILDDVLKKEGEVNITYQTEGLKFLIRTLPLNYIDNSKLHTICECFRASKTVELKGLFIQLLNFVVDPSIDEILNDINEISSDFSQVSLHHSISTISHLLVGKSPVSLLYLITNDVPIIRKRAAMNFSGEFLNEDEIVKEIVKNLKKEEKSLILKYFIDQIQKRMESDEFGEPVTFTVDEFYVLFSSFEEIKMKFLDSFKEPMTLNEMRKAILEIAKSYQ